MKTAPFLVLLAATTLAGAAEKPAACSCRSPETAPAAFSRNSIYQIDGRFTDDAGRPFTLGTLRGHPVVLDMFFASCGYACPLTVTDMLALQQSLPAGLRDRTRFVLVSFDVERDTPAALARYRARRRLGDHWILLHGDEDSVRELAAVLGVQYRETADGGFTHSNQLTVLDSAGEIVHRRPGLGGGLDEIVRALAAAR